MSAIVEVPGYANLRDFSRDFQGLIQERLERWQVLDGLLGFAWVDGAMGDTELPADEMKDEMNILFMDTYKSQALSFLKLQLPGISAHAWILVSMIPTATGFDFYVIESNAPTQNIKTHYEYGDTHLSMPYNSSWTFVPSLDFEADLDKIAESLREACGSQMKLPFAR